jgi:hypothetical protein
MRSLAKGSEWEHEIAARKRRHSWIGHGGGGFATARLEYPVNLEVLNGYVLGLIALFAVCLYVAVVATGLAELMSGTSSFRTRKKCSRDQSATRNWRNAKRSSHS